MIRFCIRTLFGLILLLSFCIPLYAYQYIGGDESCLKCHENTYDNGTAWHKTHQSYIQDCSACHEADNAVPTKNCKLCHTNLPCRWVDAHRESNINVCAQCHAQECPDDGGDDNETCPASSCLGKSDARLDTVRVFRDKVLAQSTAGRTVIRIYYRAGAGIVEMLDRNPTLKAWACRMLSAFVFVMEPFIH